MYKFIAVIIVSAPMAMLLAPASADESCKAQAADKKLAGAALTSFMNKCERDAKTACNTRSDKKLSGAAKDSFTKKCVKDAVGT